ncbi:MAG: tRNA (guanosine(46)-N7)-methyltransferase TrmB [Sedimentisphaerales bacterium]|nr:tRNA (guanosine(46)-N7)-methyltransferase TrmB [Sedimentisphaerales bacterium]
MTVGNEDIAVDICKYAWPLNLQDMFGRAAPVEIEIGSGKGTFLLHQARRRPGDNFLGIEWAGRYYRYSVDRMRRWRVANVRILRTDARDFLARSLADGCVSAFHVYFPDPWPKKRHQKRRFFQPTWIEHLARCLKAGGTLRTATDHAGYFQVIRELLLDRPQTARYFDPTAFFPAESAGPGEWVGSNFERKYQKEGRPIHTLAVRRNDCPAAVCALAASCRLEE